MKMKLDNKTIDYQSNISERRLNLGDFEEDKLYMPDKEDVKEEIQNIRNSKLLMNSSKYSGLSSFRLTIRSSTEDKNQEDEEYDEMDDNLVNELKH